jgi:hypothetical protein
MHTYVVSGHCVTFGAFPVYTLEVHTVSFGCFLLELWCVVRWLFWRTGGAWSLLVLDSGRSSVIY